MWVDIKGYKNQYQVSSFGRIKSLSRLIIRKDGKKRIHKSRILIQVFDRRGYLYISLWTKNFEKRFSVARLVALNFLTKKKNKLEVNHINGIPKDNRLCNLEWTDRSGNVTHSYRILKRSHNTKNAVLSRIKKVNQYTKDGAFMKSFKSVSDAAISVNTTSSAISGACNGKYASIRNFKWQYA